MSREKVIDRKMTRLDLFPCLAGNMGEGEG
jgi:hypothetical protein